MTTTRTNRKMQEGVATVLSAGTSTDPGISPQDAEYLPSKGMMRNKPSTRLIPSEAWTLKNVHWKDNTFRTRTGSSALGDHLPEAITGIFMYTDANVGDFVVVALLTKFAYHNGAAWVPTTGPVLTGHTDQRYTFTQWGSDVIYANGADKIGAIDLGTATHAPLLESPIAYSCTNFGRRIVAVGVANFPERVQWSVAGNSQNWTGLGSGFEDLRAAPGGVVDDALLIVPMTDEIAMLIKRRTIWTMMRTELFDAPFQFSRRYQSQGTNSPHTFKLTPIGVIGLFLDDIYVFSHTEAPRPIGTGIRSELFLGGNLNAASAVYDTYLNEYRLLIPATTKTGVSVIWRYNIVTGIWTFDVFPFDAWDMAVEFYTSDPIIDMVEDVIDSVDIPIDDMVGVLNTSGLFISQYGETGKVVAQMLDGNTMDITQGSLESTAPVPIEMHIGEIVPNTNLRRGNLIEMQLEHFNSRALTVTMEYSEDGGSIWNMYDSWDLAAVGIPTIARYARYLESKRLTVRIICLDATGMVVNSWVLRTQMGAKHAP